MVPLTVLHGHLSLLHTRGAATADPEFVATRMECAATIVGRNRLMFDIGEFFELSTPASGFHNPVWSLHLFEATTLEAAMLERDLEYGPDFHFEWKTQP